MHTCIRIYLRAADMEPNAPLTISRTMMLARPLFRTNHPRPVTPMSDDTKAMGANT
jgi:hypothetical protein